ncbi:MAG: phosphatidylcholine/phosphatidylserine synthase [Alphaproteobacteria bacterium]|nr:phosphatidylcholine/phosphatidylserine synthase [Alphaproteobacteria bacterium]MDE2042973.1 phosphatidylcholine/phosphatidylserine synthase [Alphaproteobacteria bacterium]MDE2340641.1 phosphatidylcholine/phosphatidylserine synthase [Alphaproteobacteria bacterium]
MKMPGTPARTLPVRALVPNAITALALCSGLTGIRYAILGQWDWAALSIVLAALFDGLDGRIARLLRGTSRFGAELDSLSDIVAFGVAPALIMFLWSLEASPRIGWMAALAHAVCCALRLARFNAQLDTEEVPYKRAGFLTGVPAPAAAAISILPLFLWLALHNWPDTETLRILTRSQHVVAAMLTMSAMLMLLNLPSWSWRSFSIAPRFRIPALAIITLIFAELIMQPWETLSVATLVYILILPLAWYRYARVRQHVAQADAT